LGEAALADEYEEVRRLLRLIGQARDEL